MANENIQIEYYLSYPNQKAVVSIPARDIAMGIKSIDQMADLMNDYLNNFNGDYEKGIKIGEAFTSKHRTIQSCLYRFCLGAIIGLSRQEFTDARNEVAVENGKKIAKMVEDKEIKIGWMI